MASREFSKIIIHIRRCLVPLNDRHFVKLGGESTKVIFILFTFTTFIKKFDNEFNSESSLF